MSNFEEFYGVSEAARLCGVQAKQILYWERRGYIPEAARIKFGLTEHRRFSEEDLTLIRTIKEYMEEGFTLQAAARKTKEEIVWQ